mgnify:CR=1 FL=1
MFPDRLPWIAVGSGELVNEHITGGEWPEKAERNERLREGAEVMRALLRGEEVTHRGRITVSEAKLYSLPRRETRLVGAAVSEATAEWLGGWADGLLTVGRGPESVRKVVEAARAKRSDRMPYAERRCSASLRRRPVPYKSSSSVRKVRGVIRVVRKPSIASMSRTISLSVYT